MWAAMSFLLSSIKVKARRLKILQLLLLLSRILIICLVVIALARPHLTGALFAGFLSGERTASVVLLDVSLSMAAKSGDTAFERARKAIEEIVTNFRRGDSITLVTFSSRSTVVAQNVTSAEALKGVISNMSVCDGSTNVQLGLAKALAILGEEKNARKEVYLVTDGRKNGWNVDDIAGWERIDEMISAMKTPPKIHIVDVGSPEIDNSTISNVEIEAADSSTAGKYEIGVELQGYGSALTQTPVAKLFLDDMSKEKTRIKGSDYENGVSYAQQPFDIDDEGFHFGKVELLETDALAGDNTRYFSVRHKRGLRVLCVEGLRKGGLYKTAVDLIRIALAPEKDMEGNIIIPADYTNVMVPELVSLSKMYEKRLRDYEVVVLSNAPSIEGRDYEGLKYFVSRGGGLVIFAGDGIEPEKYNTLSDNDDRTFLPARIGSIVGRPSVSGRRADDPEYVLSEFDYRHPMMKNFQGGQDGDLTLFKFYAYHRLEVDELDPDVKVLSRFNNGDAFIVERRVGRGKALLVASDPTSDWSNMGSRPAFLPLVHHMTRYLSGESSRRYNITAGGTISYPAESSEKPVTVENPSGTVFKLQPKMMGDAEMNLPFIEFDETLMAGIYSLYMASDEEGLDESSSMDKVYFAVNPGPSESDLTSLDAKVMKGMLNSVEINFIKYGRGFESRIRESRYGKEIWRYFMLAALVFLVTETSLAYVIDRT